MQTLLGPAKLEGLLTAPSEGLAQHDLEPASPFANVSAVSNFWKGSFQLLPHVNHKICWTLLVCQMLDSNVQSLSWIVSGKRWMSKAWQWPRTKRVLSKADVNWRKPPAVCCLVHGSCCTAAVPHSKVRLPAEFKKGATPELNRDVGTLLKAYQEEVDRLTTRYWATDVTRGGFGNRSTGLQNNSSRRIAMQCTTSSGVLLQLKQQIMQACA